MNRQNIIVTIILCAAVILLVLLTRPGPSGQDVSSQAVPTAEKESGMISVTGTADILAVPDQIVVTLGLETRNRDIARAKEDNDKKLSTVLAVADHFKIGSNDIQLDYMNVSPCDMSVLSTTNYYKDIDPANLGTVVRKRIVVTINDLSVFESFLTEAIKSGVEYVEGVEFRTTRIREYKDQARTLAVKAAKEKADAMSSALGQKAGKAVNIIEQQECYWSWYGSWYGGWYGGSSVSSAANVTQNLLSSGQSSVDTATPGQIKIRASVAVDFELD